MIVAKPMRGTPPTLQFVALEQLQVDAAYQRSLETKTSQALIARIATNWDWSLCQPLAVARRGDNIARGGLFVVDGQHRLAAARLRRDVPHLPCVVTAFEDAAGEAAAFVKLNSQRRALSRLDLFRAAIAGDDEEATAVLRAVQDAGLAIAPHTNFTAWKSGQIANVGGLFRIWRRDGGPDVTRRTLCVVARAFGDQVCRYAAPLFSAIAGVISADAAVDDALLVLILRDRPQVEWVNDFARTVPDHDGRRLEASVAVLRAAYDEAACDDDEAVAA